MLVLTANFAKGQTIDTTLRKLIDSKLIEQKQAETFEKLLGKQADKSNSAYLYTLFECEYKKRSGHTLSQSYTFINFADRKPEAAEQLKINEILTIQLSKLKYCDLIKEKDLNHFQNKIDNNEFFHWLQLLSSVMEQVALREYMNPKTLKLFADKLKSNQIVGIHYDKLIKEIEREELQNPIDFLKYCDKAIIINEADYPNEPEKYLELIYQKTASLIPELRFTDFGFQIVLDSSNSDKGSKFYDFVVSLKSNGKKYKQKSVYHLYSLSKNEYFGNKIDQQTYYAIFNKILADLQSPYRLHEVKAHRGNAVDWSKFGIIALTKEQADLLHGGGVYFSPSYENFINKLTSQKIDQAIEVYKKIGLLSHLTSQEIEQAQKKVTEQENNNLNDVLRAFPSVIYSFDTELGNLQDPYAELIRGFKQISKNDFNATEIADDFDIVKKKKVVVKFKIGSKPYKKTLRIRNDWIDYDFFNFIESVVTQQNLKGQFYELSLGGEGVNIIYLTKEQYDYLKTNKLLKFGDEWQAEE